MKGLKFTLRIPPAASECLEFGDFRCIHVALKAISSAILWRRLHVMTPVIIEYLAVYERVSTRYHSLAWWHPTTPSVLWTF